MRFVGGLGAVLLAAAPVIGLAFECGADTPSSTGTARPSFTRTPHATLPEEPSVKPIDPKVRGELVCRVTRVVDGDTQHLDCGGQKDIVTRNIGIDTPETKDPRKPVQCYGPEATAEAHRLLDGQTVGTRSDITQGSRDRYGRLLVYLILPDGRDYGLAMIRGGFAREYTYDEPYRMRGLYRDGQRHAQAAGRGLWGACSR